MNLELDFEGYDSGFCWLHIFVQVSHWRRTLDVFLGLQRETLVSPDFCRGPEETSQGASERWGTLWIWRGLSGLHWVCRNGRGPHLEWRQETHVSSPDFPWARSDSDRSFAAEFEQESQASSCVEERNSACLSSCSRDDRSLLELCVLPAGFSGRYPGVSVPLRVVPSSKGLFSKRCPGIRILSRADREIGVFRHVSQRVRHHWVTEPQQQNLFQNESVHLGWS